MKPNQLYLPINQVSCCIFATLCKITPEECTSIQYVAFTNTVDGIYHIFGGINGNSMSEDLERGEQGKGNSISGG